MNFFLKCTLVIFLTLLFKIIGAQMANLVFVLYLILSLILVCSVVLVVISQRKINLVLHSAPAFLNFINLTMSTGKSMSSAFEIAITYQNETYKPYYRRMYQRIFFLKNQNSGFFFKSHQDFYRKLYLIADSTAYQREKIIKLKQQIESELEILRKESALKAPFRVQTFILGFIYLVLLIWHFNFRDSYPEIEKISFGLFLLGLLVSFFMNKKKIKI